LGETKRLRFEFNAINVFNQKTARYQQNIVTRYRDASSAMDMSNVNLLKGYNWKTLLAETTYAQDKTRTSIPDIAASTAAGRNCSTARDASAQLVSITGNSFA
jgi:hypothetical protein